jgi:hypothetical protein
VAVYAVLIYTVDPIILGVIVVGFVCTLVNTDLAPDATPIVPFHDILGF